MSLWSDDEWQPKLDRTDFLIIGAIFAILTVWVVTR